MKTKILVSTALFLMLSSNTYSFPVIDSPQLSINIRANIEKIRSGIEKSGIMDHAMRLTKEMFNLDNMLTNNGVANSVARSNAARQEIQNIGIMEQMAAIPGVCGQVSFSFALGDIGCETGDAARKDMASPEYEAFISNDANAKEEMAKELVKDIQDTYPSLYAAEGEPDNPESNPNPDAAPSVYATNANGIMSSADAFLALDYRQYSAMSDFISLIVPDYSFRKTYSDIEGVTEEQKIQFMSLEARRAVPEQALKSILAMRTSKSALSEQSGNPSGNQLSQLYTMSKAIKEASSESAIYAISVGETSTPSQLYRARVLNLTRAVELQLEQFKKGLELEGIQATKLSYLIDK